MNIQLSRGVWIISISAMLAIAAVPVLGQGLPEITIDQPTEGVDVSTLGIALTDIPLSVSYQSAAGVDKIEVLVDGAVQCVDRFETPEVEGRRVYLWDATVHGPGEHTISVIAFAGNRSAGAQTKIVYGAVPGMAPVQATPTLSFLSPGPGEVVTGLAVLQIEASGARPNWVQFFLDGRAVGHSLSAPHAISLDTSLYADGRHVVYAAMKTNAGTITSETMHVNFRNLDLPEPAGDPVDPVDVAEPVEPAEPVDPVVEDGPQVAQPADPVEPIDIPGPGPTDPIIPDADPADLTALEVAEPGSGETVESADPAPPGEWEPIGTGDTPTPVLVDVPDNPATPADPADPVIVVDPVVPVVPDEDLPSVRPLELELAGPAPGAAALTVPIDTPAPVEVVEPDQPVVPDPLPTEPTEPLVTDPVAPTPDPLQPGLAGGETAATPALPVPGDTPPTPVLVELATPAGDPEPVLAGPAGAPARPSGGEPLAYVDGHPIELTSGALIEGDVVLIPIRELVMAMGGEVSWDDEGGRAVGRSTVGSFAITPGAHTATVDGESVRVESPCVARDDVLYVPLSFAGQILGMTAALNETSGALEFRSPTE